MTVRGSSLAQTRLGEGASHEEAALWGTHSDPGSGCHCDRISRWAKFSGSESGQCPDAPTLARRPGERRADRTAPLRQPELRSEERRVGKECRCWWVTDPSE